MDTNINTIDSSYTSDVVTYDDSQIDTIINELNEIVNLLSSIDSCFLPSTPYHLSPNQISQYLY